jgi:hypothetical protein
VCAQEVQLQGVVDRRGGAGRRLLLDELLASTPRGIGAGGVEELAPGHGDEPALRVPRRF